MKNVNAVSILNRRPNQSGSAVVAAMAIVVILSMIAGTVILTTSNRFTTMNQASAWDRALVAAEAGLQQGIAQLDSGLDANMIASGTQNFSLTLTGSGDGSVTTSAGYTLARVDKGVGANIRPFFNITSTGTVAISGGKGVSLESKDTILRKLSLRGNTRMAIRKINAWVKPRLSTDAAILVNGAFNANNYNITSSSFDSTSTTRSYNLNNSPQTWTAGVYNNPANGDPLEGSFATNGQIMNVGNAQVWGDVMTNGGIAANTQNVYGNVRNDFSTSIKSQTAPSWYSSSYSVGAQLEITGTKNNGTAFTQTKSVTTINSAGTIYGGSTTSPTRYVVNGISLAGQNDVLTFELGTKNGNAKDTTMNNVELYVLGDFTTKGGGNNSTDSGSVVIKNGVKVTIYVVGNVNLTGNGVSNMSNVPSNFTLNVLNPPTGTAQSVKLGGDATFTGTVNAPGADLELGGTGVMVGSLVGKTATLRGNFSIFYDEALQTSGYVIGFSLMDWYEEANRG